MSMMAVPKKPGVYKVKGGRYVRRLANGRVKFVKGPSKSNRRASTSRRPRSPAKRAAPRRRSQPMKKNLVDMRAVSAGAITGAASAFAQNIPALGPFAPAVGLAVGGSFAGDASTKKTAHFLAGVSAGSALSGAIAPNAAGSPGGLL